MINEKISYITNHENNIFVFMFTTYCMHTNNNIPLNRIVSKITFYLILQSPNKSHNHQNLRNAIIPLKD